jgi:hypothetical protein
VTWEEPDPAELLILASDSDWNLILDRYPCVNDRPLRRCLEVARLGGASTVAIETRYIDRDYRSEFTSFYSKTFGPVPDSAHRLHFFRSLLAEHQLWDLPQDAGYLGYVVIRPSELGRVGRTVLAPPPGLATAVRASVKETINFFGQNLSVEGMPFVQQDTQLGRCAHAAMWMCHYLAHRHGSVERKTMAEVSLYADPGLGIGRPLPSSGLTVPQLLELSRVFGLPPIFYDIENLPTARAPWAAQPPPKVPAAIRKRHPGFWDGRIFQICCRYLNSGIPLLVTTEDHVFVLCGFRRRPRRGKLDWIEFVRHDDQCGPYLVVNDVFSDQDPETNHVYTPWQSLIVPLPEKLWLPPDPVERKAAEELEALARRVAKEVPESNAFLRRVKSKRLGLRTYAISSNEFKLALKGRVDELLCREYRVARFSRYIWVSEIVDRDLRSAGSPPVLGEAIFDATSSEHNPAWLALHTPGVAVIARSDGGIRPLRCAPGPYPSGGVGPP